MSFLSDYLEYSSGNEAPPEFHLWSGLCALAACCGPNLWMDMGGAGNIQPNLYVLLVGPPGIKKSTAKDISRDLLRKIHSNKYKIPIAPDSSSKEAFVDFLSRKDSPCKMVFDHAGGARYYTKCCLWSDEFVNLVSVGGDPMAWIQVLTEIYLPRPTFKAATIARGHVEMPYPYINLLGCMTTDITKALINDGSLSGGFSRRTIYIYSNKDGEPVPIPVFTPEQKRAQERCIQRGQEIQRLSGCFQFSPAGEAAYRDAYIKNHHAKQEAPSAALVNFMQSYGNFLIKIAMLLQLSESDELVIGEDKILHAKSLIDSAQSHVNMIFAGVGKNPHASTMAGIKVFIDQVSSRPPFFVTLKRVYAQFLNQAEQAQLESILKQMDSIGDLILVSGRMPGNPTLLKGVTTPAAHSQFLQYLAGQAQ